MKFSERWLKEWVPISGSTEKLCDQLTNAGLEVDGVARAGAELAGVVVAEVLSVKPHPRAGKLWICEVDDGLETRAVVCGAANARQGLRSALARVGAVLPGGATIHQATLHGVVSNGMLCSEAELGLGADAEGIIELDGDRQPGTDLCTALGLDDAVIDLDLTPNRGDALSIRGLAREVGLLNDLPVRAPEIADVPPTTEASFPVRIEHFAGCPRYLGRVVEDVDVTRRAPLWLRERLRRGGLRSIDPVVDVTNYVLLELGQPMHAFDLDRLEGGIRVRNAHPGESLTLLDGRSMLLDETTLVIADAGGAVAIAGVMGGERSSVSATSRSIFLECAFFSPAVIAASARRFGLHTDAAHRYERGVDCQLQAEAMQRATELLLDVAGGRAGPVVAAVDEEHLPRAKTVTLRRARLDHLVGEKIPSAEVLRIFERLELAPKVEGDGDATVWTATSPSHRFDIEREEDLVEEVLRIHGYNTVAGRAPAAPAPLGSVQDGDLPVSRLADLLVDLGYSEAITFSFLDPILADALDPDGKPLRVLNPVSGEQAVMRTSLFPGLIGALRNNLARQADRVRLFELGQCFRSSDGGLDQVLLCGGILFGPREEANWAQGREAVDFFDAKGDVERLVALGGRTARFQRSAEPALHPGQSAELWLDGQPAGRLGRLHPEVESTLELPAGIFVFEADARALLARRLRRHGGLSRQPSVRRDLALLVDRSVAAADIESVVRRSLGELVSQFRLFDVYIGEGIDSNRKSVAISLTLQHSSQTLTDGVVNQLMEGALTALSEVLGARLR